MIDKHLLGLKRALERSGGTHTLQDMIDQIENERAQIWCNEDACIVTEVNDTPRKRVLHFWLATGDLDAVIALSGKVLVWGKEQGCDMATLTGRRGWNKTAPQGWTSVMTVMTRELL